MKIVTLDEITQGQDWVGLGIAGNQAEHLAQAGEADDFKEVVALENAPKGMFPWYIPGSDSFLGVHPLSHDRLNNNSEGFLQPEPEIALVVKFEYSDRDEKLLDDISVLGFSAFNDCSRRVAAAKISQKKNWGAASQGMAKEILSIDDFTREGGTSDNYRLTCYLKRDGELLQYGKDTAVTDYCYSNQTLVDWMVNQINTQQDNGPLEPIGQMLVTSKPAYGIIAIGATCYSEFGNSEMRFLKEDDEILVIAYDGDQHTTSALEKSLIGSPLPESNASRLILQQQVTTISPPPNTSPQEA
ncbi:DUF5718 family protein [Rubritalea profundi]|uniref:DUF5718 family protein n=1 Tax=Rubritalea profundi TaxID=1658618 RepID=UPI000CF36F35|nr:DUF5718 family protein [Rubritalea profundi]